MGIHEGEDRRNQGNPEGGCAQEVVILLPLFPQELAFVRKAMRALSVFGDERDIRMNIETSIDRCREYEPLAAVDFLEFVAFKP